MAFLFCNLSQFVSKDFCAVSFELLIGLNVNFEQLVAVMCLFNSEVILLRSFWQLGKSLSSRLLLFCGCGKCAGWIMVAASWLTITRVVSRNGSGAFIFLSGRNEEIAVDCGDDVWFDFGSPASGTSIS